MMKKILLILSFSLVATTSAFASATVILEAENAKAALQAINNQTSAGFIGYGGKYTWKTQYVAEPGTYTLTGKSPGCPKVVESASFENGQTYHMILREDCRIERSFL